MAVQRKKLRVLPNPWLHIDEKGQPAGLCRLEQPGGGTFIHGWVGVTVTKVTEVEAPKRVTIKGRTFEHRAGIHYLTFAHADEPVTVANTQYYRKRVAAGDLVAFDLESAVACGISPRNFVKPAELLEQMRSAAIVQFDAENGQGAFETLADMAEEEAQEQAQVAKAVADASGNAVQVSDAPVSDAAPNQPPVLEGQTLPADGTTHAGELEPIPGQAPLPDIENDATGNAVMTEREAPALTSEVASSRSKRNKGSEQ